MNVSTVSPFSSLSRASHVSQVPASAISSREEAPSNDGVSISGEAGRLASGSSAVAPPAASACASVEGRASSIAGWKAAAVAFLAATSLLGVAGQAMAATPEAAPAAQPAQSELVKPNKHLTAHQGSSLAGQTAAAVTRGVVDAANKLAVENPGRPITINIRDITVTVVGFDEVVDAEVDHAPKTDSTIPAPAPAPSGQAAPGAPAQPAAGAPGEISHRTFDLSKGDLRMRARQDLRPAPAPTPQPGAPTPAN
ncbi:MAG: hypothetical protein EB084_17255 [Proteobacteria bacterium]|nr:hypothetical protein [Pseudomonadota bacterium]